MTRGAAFLLALGFAAAAFLYGGIWEYGEGFIFNRFSGQVVYVDLPEDDDAVQLRTDHRPRPPSARRLRAPGPSLAAVRIR